MAIAILLMVYGAITEVSGIMGYNRAGSKAARIAGMVSSALLIASSAAILYGRDWGMYLGMAATIALIVIFAKRYTKDTAAQPVKILLGISVVVAAALFAEIFD